MYNVLQLPQFSLQYLLNDKDKSNLYRGGQAAAILDIYLPPVGLNNYHLSTYVIHILVVIFQVQKPDVGCVPQQLLLLWSIVPLDLKTD